jgi:hypothetical protein
LELKDKITTTGNDKIQHWAFGIKEPITCPGEGGVCHPAGAGQVFERSRPGGRGEIFEYKTN